MHATAASRSAAAGAGLTCCSPPAPLNAASVVRHISIPSCCSPSPSLPKPQDAICTRPSRPCMVQAANSPPGSGADLQQQQQQHESLPLPDWSDAALTDMLGGSSSYLSEDTEDMFVLPEGLQATDSFDQDSAMAGPTSTTDEDAPAEALSDFSDGISGEPALEELLAECGQDLSVERLARLFTFPFDKFQATALEHFVEGKSVVVCAPTGAGKTAIAEAAAAATLARGQRVIYTTPLKALSNQKLCEVRKRFGSTRCGLQTGDTSLNTEADIVIMTTEILRNIMYRTAEVPADPSAAPGIGPAPSANTREARLGDVGLVVLDEVHYLGDPHRGSVWEEVIINCPRHIQLVCMSATVCNPEDLGHWISKEHQECVTIRTKFRPVPLHWRFAYRSQRGVMMENLLDDTGKALNPKLSAKEVLLEEARLLLRQQDPSSSSYYSRGGSRGGGRYNNRAAASAAAAAAAALPWDQQLKSLMASDPDALQRRVNLVRIPTLESVITKLQRLNYLPAIWFILSRKDCDLNAIRSGSVEPLTSLEDQAEIIKELEALRADQPEAVREKMVAALINGIASHHAGHLPGWKAMVERLFQRGLCKIVYATGTLAAGLNMPARTTIISALGRKTDDGIKLLPHNELLQMAGRAGRRGFDTVGHCVVLQNRFEGAEEAFKIIKAGPESLSSQFKASYGLVLNLLTVYTLDEAKAFVSRSFGNFLQTEGQQLKLQEVAELEAKAKELMEEYQATASIDTKELNAEAKAARRRLRSLKAQALGAHVADVAATLLAAGGLPRKVLLRVSAEPGEARGGGGGGGGGGADEGEAEGGGPGQYVPAVLVEEVEPSLVLHLQPKGINPTPFYACLGADNRLMQVSAIHVARVMDGDEGGLDSVDIMRLQASFQSLRPKAWSDISKGLSTCQVTPGNTSTAKIAMKLNTKDSGQWLSIDAPPRLVEEMQQQRLFYKGLLNKLDAKRKTSEGKDASAHARRLLKRAEAVRSGMTDSTEGIWMTFKSVMEVLISLGAMEAETLRLLPLGLLSRSLRVENELWLAMALTHPSVQDLNGPQLAAFLGALISSEVIKRPVTMWDSYSSSDEVIRVVEALEPTRQALFEAQTDAGLSRWNDSLVVDLRLAGLVEAWAAGATWTQIMGDSTLDDGDVARLFMRTSDLLRQVVHTPQLLPQLKDAASEALRGMDRKPVADMSGP